MWASASVRSASVSKISTDGPPLATSESTTGAAASVRSPEKPAAQPMRRTDAEDTMAGHCRERLQICEIERCDTLIRNANQSRHARAERVPGARRAAQL